MVTELLKNFCSILGEFPDPNHGEAYTRDILHCFGHGQTLITTQEPPSTFVDNLRFYDFVLHAKDVKKIFLDGECNKQARGINKDSFEQLRRSHLLKK